MAVQKKINPKASELHKRIAASANAPKRHKPERAIKGIISFNFWEDGLLFIEISDKINTTELMENRHVRSKMIVNLIMSLECSLKSLIISLSEDKHTPKEAYQEARSLSHKIDKLYEQAKIKSKKRFKIPPKNEILFQDLIDLKLINSRYSYEVWRLIMNSNVSANTYIINENIIDKTVDNVEWFQSLRKEAAFLNDAAYKCYTKYLVKHQILYGKRFNDYDIALKNFLS